MQALQRLAVHLRDGGAQPFVAREHVLEGRPRAVDPGWTDQAENKGDIV